MLLQPVQLEKEAQVPAPALRELLAGVECRQRTLSLTAARCLIRRLTASPYRQKKYTHAFEALEVFFLRLEKLVSIHHATGFLRDMVPLKPTVRFPDD